MQVSIEQIKKTLDARSTEELQAILDRHDIGEYTEEAFEAMREVLAAREQSSVQRPAPLRAPRLDAPRVDRGDLSTMAHVVVTDVHMPLGSMVVFMVKWALASIPALIILFCAPGWARCRRATFAASLNVTANNGIQWAALRAATDAACYTRKRTLHLGLRGQTK